MMSMSELPTSVFDPFSCAILLWGESVQVLAGTGSLERLGAIDVGCSRTLEEKILKAVQAHLAASLRLETKVSGAGADQWADPLPEWDAVSSAIEQSTASLTPRSHAFHMRLASKYADYYRGFEQKALVQWVTASKMKSEFLTAIALSRFGNFGDAASLAGDLSDRWRTGTPIRLPGLLQIERAGSAWAEMASQRALAQLLGERAGQLTDRLAPYPDDDPSVWEGLRTPEQIVRFGFAAAVLPPKVLV